MYNLQKMQIVQFAFQFGFYVILDVVHDFLPSPRKWELRSGSVPVILPMMVFQG